MGNFTARQPVALHNGTEEKGFDLTKPYYIALSDGTEVVSVNASNQLEVSVENTVEISDGGGSITVDGTVAATQSGTWNITTLTGITNDVNIADGGNSISVDDGGGILTVDGTVAISGTVVVSATDLDIRNLLHSQDSILVYANTAKDGSGTSYVPIVTTDGILRVDIASGQSGRTEYSDGAVAAAHVGAVIMGSDGTNLQTIVTDAAGNLQVDLASALPTGTNSIGNIGTLSTITNDVNIADGGNSITIDGTVAATQSGVWNIGTVASITADVSIDDGGNVISVDDGGASLTVDGTVAATQSGTWNITTLTGITNDVNIADGGNVISVDDGGGSLTIDGTVGISGTVVVSATNLDIRDLTSASDSVEILQDTHDDLNANANIQVGNTDVSSANPVPVVIQDNVASSTEVQDYQTTADVLKTTGTTTHTYTVTAAKTLIIDSISISASGKTFWEVKVGPSGSEVTVRKGFTSASSPDKDWVVNGKIEVAATHKVLIIINNEDNGYMDVFSTLIGNEV